MSLPLSEPGLQGVTQPAKTSLDAQELADDPTDEDASHHDHQARSSQSGKRRTEGLEACVDPDENRDQAKGMKHGLSNPLRQAIADQRAQRGPGDDGPHVDERSGQRSPPREPLFSFAARSTPLVPTPGPAQSAPGGGRTESPQSANTPPTPETRAMLGSRCNRTARGAEGRVQNRAAVRGCETRSRC